MYALHAIKMCLFWLEPGGISYLIGLCIVIMHLIDLSYYISAVFGDSFGDLHSVLFFIEGWQCYLNHVTRDDNLCLLILWDVLLFLVLVDSMSVWYFSYGILSEVTDGFMLKFVVQDVEMILIPTDSM